MNNDPYFEMFLDVLVWWLGLSTVMFILTWARFIIMHDVPFLDLVVVTILFLPTLFILYRPFGIFHHFKRKWGVKRI